MILRLRDSIIAQVERKYEHTAAKFVGKLSLVITSNYLPRLLRRTAQNAIVAIQFILAYPE
jgi:hypothetical protein